MGSFKIETEVKCGPNNECGIDAARNDRELGLDIDVWQLYKAKKIAREENEGTHSESYKKLKKYIEQLMARNPETIVKLQYHDRQSLDDPHVFKRLFIMFNAMKMGFIQGCKPFLGLDGTHLKGAFGGVLLVTIALDGNRGVIPVAFAIVESESTASWKWFIEILKTYINSAQDGTPLTFMSDRQKVSLNIYPFCLLTCCNQIFILTCFK